MQLKKQSTTWSQMTRQYVNQAGSGEVSSSMRKGKSEYDVLKERIMMIAERLVAAEKEIKELKAKIK